MRSARPATAICCIVLVVLAGCSGIPGLGGDAYTEPGEPLNASALLADHTATLREAGSFTATVNGSSAVGNESVHQRTLVRADIESNRTLRRTNVTQSGGQAGERTQAVFVENETAYLRTSVESANGTRTQYRVVNTSGRSAQGGGPGQQFLTLEGYAAIVEGANWTQRGTESYRGTTVTRYTANGSDSFNASALGASAPNVTDFQATLLVTADGTVRKLSFTLEAGSQDRSFTVTNDLAISDVGSTTVEPPGWLDEARNASSTRSEAGAGTGARERATAAN